MEALLSQLGHAGVYDEVEGGQDHSISVLCLSGHHLPQVGLAHCHEVRIWWVWLQL